MKREVGRHGVVKMGQTCFFVEDLGNKDKKMRKGKCSLGDRKDKAADCTQTFVM